MEENIWTLLQRATRKDLDVEEFSQNFLSFISTDDNTRQLFLQSRENDNQDTLLHKLVSVEDESIVEAVLSHFRTDVELSDTAKLRNCEGMSTLHLAVKKSNKVIIESILGRISNEKLKQSLVDEVLDQNEDDTPTLLHLAVKENQLKILKILLDALRWGGIAQVVDGGPSTEETKYWMPQFKPDSEGYNVLHLSATKESSAYIIELIRVIPRSSRQCYLAKQANDGATFFHLAFEAGNVNTLNAVKKQLHTDELSELLKISDLNCYTPMHIAVEKSMIASLKELLSGIHDKLPEILGVVQNNPLHLAAKLGQSFHELLDLIPNDKQKELLFLPTSEGQTVLHIACSERREHILGEVKKNLTPDHFEELLVKKDNKSRSVLHCAVENGHYSLVNHVLFKFIVHEESFEQLVLAINDRTQTVLDLVREKHPETAKSLLYYTEDFLSLRMGNAKTSDSSFTVAKMTHLMDLVIHKAGYGRKDILNSALRLMQSDTDKLCLLLLLATSGIDNITNNRTIVRENLVLLFHFKDRTINKIIEQLIILQHYGNQDKNVQTRVQNSLHSLMEVATSDKSLKDADQYILKWTNSRGDTLVHLAAWLGDEAMVKRLVQWQVTSHPKNQDSVMHSKNDKDQTPEMIARRQFSKSFWFNLSSGLDRYPIPTKDQLKFLTFYMVDGRENGAEAEKEDLTKIGEAFGVETASFQNPTSNEVKEKIQNAIAENPDCLLVSVLAHGKNGRVRLKDGRMSIYEIVTEMGKMERGKPVVLLLQCCLRDTCTRTKSVQQMSGDESQAINDEELVERVNRYLADPPKKAELKDVLSQHQKPSNLVLPQAAPALKKPTSTNLVLRSLFAVAKIADNLKKDIPNQNVMGEHARDSMTLLSRAYHFLRTRPTQLRKTTTGSLEEYHLNPNVYAFDHVPRDFLCLSATVDGWKATRGLLTKLLVQKLGEMDEDCIDIERLFEHVLAAVHAETYTGQVSIIARTLLKRLCLRKGNA